MKLENLVNQEQFYAMGATQHTTATQYIRSYAILQLLLGNMGMPGGGINAMRGDQMFKVQQIWHFYFILFPIYE